MRSAQQIGRTVGEWHDYQRAERARILRALLAELRRAKETRAEWYWWIIDGRPELTRDEYQMQLQQHGRGRRAAQRGASA